MPTGKRITVEQKSEDFALVIINTYKLLVANKEFVMSKQLLKSGTAIGAMIGEAQEAESKADFIHKMSLALKEARETKYWLRLLYKSNFLSKDKLSIEKEIEDIYRKLIRIIKTSKGIR